MPEYLQPFFAWLDSFQTSAVLFSAVGIMLLVRTIWRAAKKALPGLKRAIEFIEALFRLPVFMESTTQFMDNTTQNLAEVRHEVLPNSGGSMRDDLETVTLIVEKLDLKTQSLEEHDRKDHERLSDLEATINRRREIREQKQADFDSTIPPYPHDQTEE